MKKKYFKAVSSLLTLAMLAGSVLGGTGPVVLAQEQTQDVKVWVQNSADRAFESTQMPQGAPKNIQLYGAQNEYEAAQILVRSGSGLTNLHLEAGVLTGEGGNIPTENISIFREYSNPAEVPGDVEAVPDGSNLYTDALLHNEPVNAAGGVTQPYWVRILVPKGQTPGWYTGNVSVVSDQGTWQVPVSVKVYDVAMPDTNEAAFKMLNWFGSAGCDFGALESSVPSQYNVELYDENWWKVMESFARDLSTHRNNVIFLDVQALLMPGSILLEEAAPAISPMGKVPGENMPGEDVSCGNISGGDALFPEAAGDGDEDSSNTVSSNENPAEGFNTDSTSMFSLQQERLEFTTGEDGKMRAGKYLLDWNTFDRMVEIFMDAGALQYIYAPGSYLDMGEGKTMNLWVLEMVNGKMTRVKKPIYSDQAAGIVDPAVTEYMGTFFTALRSHMQQRYPEYVDKMYISAQDEPSDNEQIKAANWFYSRLKEVYPEAKSNEAHSRFLTGLTESSTLCPVLDVYENNQEFYQGKLAEGKELWYYTCIGPQGDYLNRFIPYHLIKTRLIPWYAYKTGSTGYLHWGYCWWRTSDTFDSKQTGDEWLVRPDVENYDVFTSVRNEAQLDGIEDYELIKLLEAKDQEAARRVVDLMIKSAVSYSQNGQSAMEAHKMLLDLLTDQEPEPVAIPVFEDTFSNGYDYAWNRVTGKWKAETGTYTFLGSGANKEGMTNLREWKLSDGKVSVTMNIGNAYNNDDSMWGGITFRKTNPGDTMWQSGYTVYLRKNGKVEMIRTQPFVSYGEAQTVPDEDGNVRLSVSMKGSTIQVFQEGNPVPLIEAADDVFGDGYISLIGTGADVTYSEVKLYSYLGVIPSPVTTKLVKDQSCKDSFQKGAGSFRISPQAEVMDEKLVFESGGSAGLEGRVFSDAEYSFDFTINGNQTAADAEDYWAGLTFGKETVYGDIWQNGGYMLLIRKTGAVELMNQSGVIASGTTQADFGGAVNVKAVRSGEILEVYLQNSREPVLTAEVPEFREGFFSFNCDGGEVSFDNLVITGVQKEDQYILLDDFSSDLSKWNVVQYPDYANIKEGVLCTDGVVIKENSQEGIQGKGVSPELVFKEKTFGNLRMSFDVAIDNTALPENWAGAYFHSGGQKGFWKDGGYLVYVTNLGNLVLYKMGVGNLATAKLASSPADGMVNIQVEILNGNISIYADHSTTPLIQVKDNSFTQGCFGIMSDYADARFDNVKYLIPEENFDDFSSDTGKWLYNHPSNSVVADGVLTLKGTQPGADSGLVPDPYAAVKEYILGDGFISFDMKITRKQKENQDFWAGCAVRTSSEKGFWGNGGYLMYLSTSGELTLYREGTQALATVDTGLNPMEEFVNLKIEMEGEVLKVYVNRSAEPAITVTDNASLEGYVCLTSDWTDAEFDNVIIKGLRLPEEKEEAPVEDEAYEDDFAADSGAFRIVNGGDGSITIADGKMTAKGTNGANPVLAALKGRTYTDVDISFDMVLPVMESGWAGMSFGRQKWNDSVWNSGYFLYGGYSTKNQKTELKLFKSGAGDVGAVMIDGVKGGTVKLRISIQNKVISIYEESSEDPLITYTDSGYLGGYLAFCSYMSAAVFDNFKAAKGNTVYEDVDYTLGFARDQDWIFQQQSNGNWEKTENGIKASSVSSDYSQISLKDYSYTDASISFDMTQQHGEADKWTYCAFRRTNADDGIWTSGYFLFYNQAKGWLKIFKTGVGEFGETNIGVKNGETRNFKIVMDGNTFRVFVDGEKEPAIVYTDEEAKYQKGYIAFGTIDYASAEFMNFKVTVEGGDPEEPGEPDNPEEPGEPGTPEEPGNPEEPGEPGTPEEPGNPEEPEEPGTPEEPGNPEEPGKPGTPEEPGNPDQPQQPDHPEADRNAGSSAPEADWKQISKVVSDRISRITNGDLKNSVVIDSVTGNVIQVPQTILQALRNKDITAAFHTGQGLTFSISGRQVTDKAAGRIMDLSVLPDKEVIPARTAAEKTKGALLSRQISMTSRDNFGMTVNMHLDVKAENAGNYANLYSYHANTGKLDYRGSFKITVSGQAMFGIRQGSSYLVTVTRTKPDEKPSAEYTVVKGDTLSSIAVRNKMRSADLAADNPEVKNNMIYPGQKLYIRIK